MPRGGARAGAGRPKKVKPDLSKSTPAAPATADAAPEISDQSPLDFLLSVQRNPRLDMKTRIQAASIAAPYMHSKVTEPGKREGRRQAAAKLGEAAGSRFAASAPPKLVAAGGKKV